jgi:hypothetical protein
LDGGQNWQKAGGNLEQNNSGSGNGPSCRDAQIIPLADDTLYLVGTTVGLFATSKIDGINTSWEQVASSILGSTIVEYIEYRQSDGLLIVGTFGNGVYQTTINSIGDILSVSNINNKDYDYTIFPNPVVDNFSLLLDLKNISTCNVTIYDELGRQILTDKNINVIHGVNQIDLSLNGFKSGLYFIDVSIGGKSLVKQIIKK